MRGAGRTSVFKGAILTVSMRWTDRLIGFGSTLILARLLVPADFGVVAMASLVVGLADVLLSLGVNVALIRNHNATPAHYNTAWTLRLAQSAIAATVVFVAAPAAALYFNDPRIIPVLRFMALGMLLVGMENIGIITFQKEMRFGLDFRFVFLKRIVGFLTTILAAWLLRSYWASASC
jgi:lipopolysaccharide exporter